MVRSSLRTPPVPETTDVSPRIEVENDQSALKARQEKLETFLVAAGAESWSEAVEKARYLLGLFAQTSAAEDPRRQQLIKTLLADFERLLSVPSHDNDDHEPG